MTTFKASTGHNLHIQLLADETFLPARLKAERSEYLVVKAVRNWDSAGKVFMYLALGHRFAPKEIHVFYPNGQMWVGFGEKEKEAIEGAIKDGWMYTC
jgi:hypothetical protein